MAFEAGHLEKDLPGQRETVAVQTAGCQADELVAHMDRQSVNEAVLFDNTDAETGQIVVSLSG
jgi:hypothetical protein